MVANTSMSLAPTSPAEEEAVVPEVVEGPTALDMSVAEAYDEYLRKGGFRCKWVQLSREAQLALTRLSPKQTLQAATGDKLHPEALRIVEKELLGQQPLREVDIQAIPEWKRALVGKPSESLPEWKRGLGGKP
jgi:hypothetical protein